MKKIFFVGIDGASWKVIDYLLGKNELPVFKRLIGNGLRSTLFNINMINADPWDQYRVYREYVKKIPRLGMHSDVADWTTIATGVVPSKHGLVYSTQKNSKGIEISVSGKTRKKPAIWEILARLNKRIGVIGWPANWPPRILSEYTIVRIIDVLKERGSFLKNKDLLSHPTYPCYLWEELKKINYDKKIDKFIERTKGFFVQEMFYDSLNIEWGKYLLKKFQQPDFFSVSLDAVHGLSHLFWDCLEAEENNFRGAVHRKRQKKYKHIIEDYYKYLDKKLGELLTVLDKDTVVILASDHGMESSRITKKYLLMDKVYEKLNLLKYNNDGEIDWKNTQVYDNRNRWGICAIRKGFVNSGFSEKKFNFFRKKIEEIKNDRGEQLFYNVVFNKNEKSFVISPNYKAIYYSTKILLNGSSFPVK